MDAHNDTAAIGDGSINHNAPNGSSPRPISIHGNLINNQSIYANMISLPKMNGASLTGKGLSSNNENANGSAKSSSTTATTTTTNSVGANLNTSYNAILNNSRLSSSNSPSTNGTRTTVMDSSRENPHDELDFSTRISPPTTTPMVNLSRSSSHRQHTQIENPSTKSQQIASSMAQQQLNSYSLYNQNLPAHHNQSHVLQQAFIPVSGDQIAQTHTFNLNRSNMLLNRSDASASQERSLNYPHNSTIAPHLCNGHLKSHNDNSRSAQLFNASFVPNRNTNNQRVSNMTAANGSHFVGGPTSGYGGKMKLLNSSLIPENVSKFMQMSKEVGVKDAITSLGLLSLVSLLLALLSLVFLLKLSPVTEERRREMYRFDFLSATEYVAVYEVTLGMCALALSLNLCCLLVCSIQFLLAVKLVKSSPVHGKSR